MRVARLQTIPRVRGFVPLVNQLSEHKTISKLNNLFGDGDQDPILRGFVGVWAVCYLCQVSGGGVSQTGPFPLGVPSVRPETLPKPGLGGSAFCNEE